MKKMYILFTGLLVLGVLSNTFAQKTVTVPKTNQEITVDGEANEDIWSAEDVTTNVIESMLEEGLVPPDGPADLSATWKGCYNETSLFLFVEVMDADIVYPNDDVKGWAADKLEVYFGFSPGETDANNLWDVCDVGLVQEPFLVEPDPEDGVPCAKETYSGREYAVVETVEGYKMEIKINWDVFVDGNGDPVDASVGQFMFDILVNDNDSETSTDERSQYYWSADMHLWNYPWNGSQGTIILGDLATKISSVHHQTNMIYPNPVNDELNIKGAIDHVIIYTVLGEEVLKHKLLNGNTISVKNLENGVYFINLYHNDNLVSTRKLIKAR